MTKILILGGTAEGNAVAHSIAKSFPNIHIINSFAGVTGQVPDLPGKTRIGGFGGAQGLASFIKNEGVDVVVDATHPFAATMTKNAIEACKNSETSPTPYLRFDRPRWVMPAGAKVTYVANMSQAADHIAPYAKRVLLTVGSKDIAAFSNLKNIKLFIRSIVALDIKIANATSILARPPFTLDDEKSLLRDQNIDTLITKDSGGNSTAAKITACAELGVRMVVIERPPAPKSARVGTVDEAIIWLSKLL